MYKIGLSILLFCFFYLYSNAQTKEFVFEYKYVSDTTNMNNKETELMILNIDKEKSQFYGLQKYQSDSTLLADSKKGIMSMPPNQKMINYRIIKYKNTNTLTFITPVSHNLYFVSEKKEMKWTLLKEYSEVLGYSVQKATTNFGGRVWNAWFSKDIPLQDGPYKFSGLPGLILKISDSTDSHSFELIGIRNIENDFIYPELKNYSNKFEVNYKQYSKIYKDYRKNPASDLVGKIPDYKDAEGKLIRGQQKVREIENMMKEELKKDNNILEIDLLR